MQRVVVEQRCRLGLAFDGDGDRVILVNHRGEVVDGDGTLFVCARHLQAAGRLASNSVVATVMSNIGLELSLRRAGIAMHRCPVGDRNVRDEMRRRGVCLGGEQSGHVIFSDRLPTGDGLATGLEVLRVIAETGWELADLTAGLETFPQQLVNVRVDAQPDLDDVPGVRSAVRAAERRLGDRGRVVVRYSGTEPLLRIMIEGPDPRNGARAHRPRSRTAPGSISSTTRTTSRPPQWKPGSERGPDAERPAAALVARRVEGRPSGWPRRPGRRVYHRA